MKGAFGDAKMGLIEAREIEPAPSQEAFQRLLEAPQKAEEGPSKGRGRAGGWRPSERGSERVGWWRRFWS